MEDSYMKQLLTTVARMGLLQHQYKGIHWTRQTYT